MPSDKVFIGNAAPVADVWTYTVADASSGKVHGITAGSGKTISLTLGGSETTSTAAAKLQALLLASTLGEFAEYSWSVSAAVITGAAKTTGVPGTFTGAFTALAATLTNSTPAAGPNFFSLAANFTGGTLPGAGDRIVFNEESPDALYGLDWLLSGPTVPAKVETINFTGSIGLPEVVGAANTFSVGAGSPYPEYRNRYLKLPAGSIEVNIGRGDDTLVPTRVMLNLAGTGTTLNVYGSDPPPTGERATVYVQGSTGHPRLSVSQGYVGVALDVGSAGGFLDVLIGDEGTSGTDAVVIFGDAATVPLVHNQSGESESSVTVTSLEMGLGATSHKQTDGDLTATHYAGLIDFRSSGTLTVTATGPGTTVDFSKDPRPKGLDDSSTFKAGAKLIDPGNTRTSGSGATFDQISLPLSKLGPSVPVVKP